MGVFCSVYVRLWTRCAGYAFLAMLVASRVFVLGAISVWGLAAGDRIGGGAAYAIETSGAAQALAETCGLPTLAAGVLAMAAGAAALYMLAALFFADMAGRAQCMRTGRHGADGLTLDSGMDVICNTRAGARGAEGFGLALHGALRALPILLAALAVLAAAAACLGGLAALGIHHLLGTGFWQSGAGGIAGVSADGARLAALGASLAIAVCASPPMAYAAARFAAGMADGACALGIQRAGGGERGGGGASGFAHGVEKRERGGGVVVGLAHGAIALLRGSFQIGWNRYFRLLAPCAAVHAAALLSRHMAVAAGGGAGQLLGIAATAAALGLAAPLAWALCHASPVCRQTERMAVAGTGVPSAGMDPRHVSHTLGIPHARQRTERQTGTSAAGAADAAPGEASAKAVVRVWQS